MPDLRDSIWPSKKEQRHDRGADQKNAYSRFATTRLCRLLAASALIGLLALPQLTSRSLAGGQQAQCRSGQLHLVIETQGENTTAWMNVGVRNTGARCSAASVARLTITQSGKRAAVRGNPLVRHIQRVFKQGRTTLIRADWSNWCGSRQHLGLRASFGELFAGEPFAVLPVCLSSKGHSRLVLIK